MAYQAAATGLLAAVTAQVFPADVTELAGDAARVRVVHAVPDALEVPAGSYDLDVRPAVSTDVALSLPGVTFEAGVVYDIFAIGQLAGGSLNVLIVPSMAEHGA